MNPPCRIPVLLPRPFDTPFDYCHPDPLTPGQVVKVPFGPQTLFGLVVPPDPAATPMPMARLKPVTEAVDAPPLPPDLRTLIDRVAAYTVSARGSVLKLALSVPAAFAPPPERRLLVRAGEAPERLTGPRRRVLDAVADGRARSAREIAEAAGVSEAVVRGLKTAGTLLEVKVSAEAPFPDPDPDLPAPVLRPEQAKAAEALEVRVAQGGFAPMLLEGVTGSGKTEVYFAAIARALRQRGAQILVLVPEISLTSQWLDRFERRFGAPPLVWHSALSAAERRRGWTAVAEGRARVVVGARSALFLPFPHLALIVVDEEHDPSFKQEDGVLYHARDMGVWRAQLRDCPIVLVSATPSMETRLNARDGRYAHLKLANRHGRALLPEIKAVDMRAHPPEPGEWFSPMLAQAVEATLEAGEQTLLFLNRRGYAPLTLCRACGARFECPDCSAWLVEHRYRGRLVCHHCGYQQPVPDRCFQCGAEDALVACGPGVERLAEEALRRWPQARLAVMASDTLAGPAETAALVRQIAQGQIDIVVGTQLVAKGYHFPRLTLVGVVDADLGLRGGDLRAGERTYQQLCQVAGRAGREERPGRVLLQTYEPGHPVVQALITGDADGFMALEEQARAQAGMPPYTRLAGLILSGPDLGRVQGAGRDLAQAAPRAPGVDVWGPAPAPIARLRGQHRLRFLVRADKRANVQRLIRTWLAQVKLPPKVVVRVDIDPMTFL